MKSSDYFIIAIVCFIVGAFIISNSSIFGLLVILAGWWFAAKSSEASSNESWERQQWNDALKDSSNNRTNDDNQDTLYKEIEYRDINSKLQKDDEIDKTNKNYNRSEYFKKSFLTHKKIDIKYKRLKKDKK
tara:strand:+ start:117 stop:509 length:393 start_codon:yes stop_codon:yes gene_type:complete